MISIKELYDRVNDIAVKSANGYTAIPNFNRDVNHAAKLLFEYYFVQFELNRKVHSAIQHLIKNHGTSIIEGKVNLPVDYAHDIIVQVIVAENDCDNKLVKSTIPLSKLAASEIALAQSSPIRKPSIKNPAYSISGGQIYIYPTDLHGKMSMDYFRLLNAAELVTTVDETTDIEVYDVDATTDVDFPDTEFGNILDIVLVMKGIQTRDSAIVQFVVNKMQLLQA